MIGQCVAVSGLMAALCLATQPGCSTDPQRTFELVFRFYGPTKALSERSWKLPDVEAVR